MEIWKTIPGFDKYQASNFGRIRHKKHKKIRVPSLYNGYTRYRLPDSSGTPRTVSGHRIVFLAFNGYIDDGMHIDHINRVRHDNRLENLRQITPEENGYNRHVVDNGKRVKLIEQIVSLHKSGMTPVEIHRELKKTTQ